MSTEDKKTCPDCGGSGTVYEPDLMSSMYGSSPYKICGRCNGTGKINK